MMNEPTQDEKLMKPLMLKQLMRLPVINNVERNRDVAPDMIENNSCYNAFSEESVTKRDKSRHSDFHFV